MPARLECVQPVLMSRDVATSSRFYVERLGFTLTFEDQRANPKYAGVTRDGVELHLQWHESAELDHSNDRPTYRFVVKDVEGLFEEFRQRKALNQQSVVRDTPWGTREFHIHDPDGNGLQFYRPL